MRLLADALHWTTKVSVYPFGMRRGRAESPTVAFSPGHRPGLDHSSMAVRPERAKAWPKRRGFFKYNGVGRAFALTGRKGMNSPKPRALPWAESNNWAFSPPMTHAICEHQKILATSLFSSPNLPVGNSSCFRRNVHTYFVYRLARCQEFIGISPVIYLL